MYNNSNQNYVSLLVLSITTCLNNYLYIFRHKFEKLTLT